MKKIYKEVMIVVALFVIMLQAIQYVSIINLSGAAASSASATMCMIGDVDLRPIPDQNAAVGSRFTYQVNCTSSCGEPISYVGFTFPALDSFSINSSTGLIDFTPQAGDEDTYTAHVFCDKIGFDDNNTDFQLTISFTPAPSRVNCNKNSHDILLDWTDSTADNYTIYYSSNISAIMGLDTSNVSSDVTAVSTTGLSWNDTNAFGPTTRYYTVAGTKDGLTSKTEDMPCAKHTYMYDAPVSATYGTLASNRIALFFNVSYNAEDFVQEIPGSLNPTISRLDKSNASGEFFTTHVRGLNDGNNFEMNVTTGYQITVDGYYNHTIVGKVFNDPYNLTFDAPVSSSYGTLATNLRGIYDTKTNHSAESILQLLPESLNPTISRLDKSNASGEFFTTHVRGLNDGNDYDIEIGVGYAFTTDDYHNLTQCEECFE